MTEVVFLASLQGYQADRVREMAERLKADHPDVIVRVLDGAASEPILAKHKLKFGPAILVDDRIEFVGIPRYRMLVERVVGPKVTPRTAGDRAAVKPPVPAAPATPNAASPPKPAGPSGQE